MALYRPTMSTNLSPSSSNNVIGHQVAMPRLLHFSCRAAAANYWSTTQEDVVSSSAFAPSTRRLDFIEINNNNKLKVACSEKMEDMRHIIKAVEEDPFQSLALVDAIQRLGLDHHFTQEINGVLQRQYLEFNPRNCKHHLHHTSLLFRLLRQEGHSIPADIFCNFLDENGKFDEILTRDIRSLMGLYEASQLNLEGEEILEEAADFTSKHLYQSLEYLDDDLARIVQNTLQHPHHKSIPKFMSRTFIKNFKGMFSWVKPLRDLAKMEFVKEQHMHREEFSQISKWWKGLNLCKELKLARNQPLKWYTWAMATIPDPSLSEHRIALTKCISFVYIIDDIFDIYGTLDQLTLFTQAVNRWTMTDTDELPDYMNGCLRALNDLTNEISYHVYRKYGYNPVDDLRKTWATLCDGFLVEAEWFASKDQVKAEEYLKIARVTSGVHVPMVHAIFLLGHGRAKAKEISLDAIEDITGSVATILRLWDDLGNAKDENQEGHDGSYVDYYVKEHNGIITHQLARQHVLDKISKEWKHLNRESLRLTQSSASFTKLSLDAARMIPLMYSYDENQRLPILEEHVKTVLFDDTPLDRHL